MPPSPWLDLSTLSGDLARAVHSRLGEHAHFDGDLRCNATEREDWADVMEIAGRFHGTVAGYDAVVISPSAQAEAEVQATTAVINGGLKGTVDAPRRVELQAGTRFFGSLRTMPDVLVISPDAIFGRDEAHTDPLA